MINIAWTENKKLLGENTFIKPFKLKNIQQCNNAIVWIYHIAYLNGTDVETKTYHVLTHKTKVHIVEILHRSTSPYYQIAYISNNRNRKLVPIFLFISAERHLHFKLNNLRIVSALWSLPMAADGLVFT